MKERIILFATITLSSLLLTACSGLHSGTKEDSGDSVAVWDQYNQGHGVDDGRGTFTGHPLDDPNSLLSTKVIHFGFDRSDIRPEYRRVLEAHANYLMDNSNTIVILEGHCDERGTREYNLALGEQRANAVKRLLGILGVPGNQLDTRSYGEEEPAAMGHNEAAWRKNRRVIIAYPLPRQ